MNKDDDVLYIFLHIPKCAGTTFRYHIEHNLKPEEILDFSKTVFKLKYALSLPYDIFNLKSSTLDGHKVYINFNKLNKEKRNPSILLTLAERHFSSLSKEQRNGIKIIYGHVVPYGIHKYFNKKPRYITFVRNPIARTVSCYNFLMNMYINDLPQKHKFMDYNDCLLIDEEVPSFEDWLANKYNTKFILNGCNLTTRAILELLGYADTADTNDDRIINTPLDKFHFVGITEQFDEDAHLLYNELGVTNFFENKNVSVKKHFSLEDNSSMRNLILRKNIYDQKIYELAIEMNAAFKKKKNLGCLTTQQ